ncbi:hypothetical protein AB0A60_32800 [Streptomyces sp. NPDC046275]|uniref:hypothetical protein n=1 Tax=Streptomyces sp. NPDC046275 TaxID=3157201 RepID=UPI0033DC099C
MSHTFTRPRGERAARWLTGILLAATVIGAVIVVNTALPSAWWPRTGQAFATEPTTPVDPAQEEACALIVGPAHAFCLQAGHEGTVRAAAPLPAEAPAAADGGRLLGAGSLALLLAVLVGTGLQRRRTR